MILKELDFLSPNITLYYNNCLTHKSVLSGILTILNYLVLIVACSYYIATVLLRLNPTSFYFRSYIPDPGIYEINTTQFFHYLTLKNVDYDPKAMNIIGAEMRPSTAVMQKDEDDFDHWKYSLCKVKDYAGKELSSLVKDKTGLCISEYYNCKTKKIYKINEEGFVNPTIQHGSANDNSMPYGIFLKHCKKTESNECYEENEIIEKYAQLYSVVMHVVDRYVDVNNYNDPFVNFINSYEMGLLQTSIISGNYHFNPALIKTNHGLLFDEYKILSSYSFDQVVRGTYELQENNIVAMFFFWMHNQMDFYERRYMKFVDILAQISGLFKFTSSIFFVINTIVNKYICLNDFGFFLEKAYTKIKGRNTLKLIKAKYFNLNDSKSSIKENVQTQREPKVFHKSKVTLGKVLKFYLRIGPTYYIKNLIYLRRKIMSEERMVKNYLKVKQFTTHLYYNEGNSLKRQKSKALSIVNNLCDFESQKNETKKESTTRLRKNGSGVQLLKLNDKN